MDNATRFAGIKTKPQPQRAYRWTLVTQNVDGVWRNAVSFKTRADAEFYARMYQCHTYLIGRAVFK